MEIGAVTEPQVTLPVMIGMGCLALVMLVLALMWLRAALRARVEIDPDHAEWLDAHGLREPEPEYVAPADAEKMPF